VTATNARSAQSVASASRVLGHGDFAGLTANFQWPSGNLIGIPLHLVPKELLEWGQVPTCLEVLTSEGPADESSDSGTTRIGRSSSGTTARSTVTILPSTGCAVDNMETTTSNIKRFESCLVLPAQSPTTNDEAWPVRAVSYWPTNHSNRRRIVVEATFPIGHTAGVGGTSEGLDREEDGHRIRMSVPLELGTSDGSPTVQPVSPISITCERMVLQGSGWGAMTDGGGLDGQTVSRLLGPFLRQSYDAFAQSRNDISSSLLVAEVCDQLEPSTGDRRGSTVANDGFLNYIALPWNMTLSTRRSTTPVTELSICIGHINVAPKPGNHTDSKESFVHSVLQVRIPSTDPSRPEEAMILNPSAFAFTTHVGRLT
jgi:hypothetical protein